MTTLRRLFSELPYAVVLDDEYLNSICSRCYAKGTKPCPTGCEKVVYCGDVCAVEDRQYHQFECAGFRVKPTETPDDTSEPWLVDVLVRLMGRTATRLRIDHGVADVAVGLPKGIKSRTFHDLKPASRRMRKKLSDTLPTFIDAFYQFYAGTPLVVKTSKAEVTRLYFVIVRNALRVHYPTADVIMYAKALYLNQSRFGTSCKPDLHGHIIASTPFRLAVDVIVREDEDEDESIKDRDIDFRRLKLDTSKAIATPQNGFLSLTRERIKIMKDEFFYTCRCVKCRNAKVIDFEENASIVGCEKCEEPYVWIKNTSQMKISCDCAGVPRKMKLEGDQKRIQRELQMLHIVWTETMFRWRQNPIDTRANADRIIRECEPLLMMAQRYWHPVFNLRLAQMYHSLFVAYSQLPVARPDSTVRRMNFEREWSEKAIRMGRAFLDAFEFHYVIEEHNIQRVSICKEIARHCELIGDQDQMTEWITKMKETLKKNGEFESAQLLLHSPAAASVKSPKTKV